jgi:hypothetical protein
MKPPANSPKRGRFAKAPTSRLDRFNAAVKVETDFRETGHARL